MADIALVTLQARGKLRRMVQAKLQREKVETLLTRRRGECNRCGECCKILLKCPFLGSDDQGGYTCKIYDWRFAPCRHFPVRPLDLLEVKECSYTFEPETITEAAEPAIAV
jgi:hypothetical protein